MEQSLLRDVDTFNVSALKRKSMAVRYEIERVREVKEICGPICETERSMDVQFNLSIVGFTTPVLCRPFFAENIHDVKACPLLKKALQDIPRDLINFFTYQQRAALVKMYFDKYISLYSCNSRS